MVRIGLIGLGFMGRMHLAAYRKIEGAELVAVADKDERRAKGDLSGGWGNVGGAAESIDMTGVRGTTDFEELLGMEEVELVDICVPTPLHEDLAIAALERGKHVLCEKPLALTSDSAERIAAAAEKASGLFMPAMCMRFWPQWQWIKEAIDDGRFGAVRSATFRRLAPVPPGWYAQGDQSGGAILDLHIHDTDFVCYAFGAPEKVSSRGYVGPSGKIDHVSTQYIYGDGGGGAPIVTAEGGWCAGATFPFTMRCTVNFERATADFDVGADAPLQVHRADGDRPEKIELGGDGYFQEVEYFIHCIEQGRAPRVVTAADAVTSLRVTEAEARSAETGAIEPV